MKYYMLLLFVLIGWSNIQIEEHNDDYNINKDTRIPVEITKSELYFIEDQVLYYQEDFNNLIPLGSLDYVDGIKTISQDNVYQVHEVQIFM